MGRAEVLGQEHAEFEVNGSDYDELARAADFYARELLGDRAYVRRLDVAPLEAIETMDGVTKMTGWRATVDLYWDADGVRS